MEQVAVVTGCTAGIGFHAAGQLASRGYKVIAACRSQKKFDEAMKEMSAKYGAKVAAKVSLGVLDLTSLASVQEFSAWFLKEHGKVELLVCNGGVSPKSVPHEADKQLSKDGVDVLFQTNYLSHFLLTLTLLPKLQEAKGRVIWLTSGLHRGGNADELATVQKVREPYSALYGFSMLAKMAIAFELHRRFGESGVSFHGFNPGGTASDIWRDYPAHVRCLYNTILISPERAATALVQACICEEGAAPAPPQYWNGYRCAAACKTFETWSPFGGAGLSSVPAQPSELARSKPFAGRLWDQSIAAVKAASVNVSSEGVVG